MQEHFRRIATIVSGAVGTSYAFVLALSVVVIWAMSGPLFHYSDTWQLVINTSTTVVTFLMVFLIQNSQNRDSKAFHLKLNELLRSVRGARTELVNLEELSDLELEKPHHEFQGLHERVRVHVEKRGLHAKKSPTAR